MDKPPKILYIPVAVCVAVLVGAVSLFCDLTWPVYKRLKGIKDD